MSLRKNMKVPKTTECILELKNNWVTIWFDRPEKRNSLSETLITEISQALDFIEGKPAHPTDIRRRTSGANIQGI